MARGGDGEMYQPVGTGLQGRRLETSATAHIMEKVMVTLSTLTSWRSVVVVVVVAALSGMTVVAVVKLRSTRLVVAVERVDVTKVL